MKRIIQTKNIIFPEYFQGVHVSSNGQTYPYHLDYAHGQENGPSDSWESEKLSYSNIIYSNGEEKTYG